MDPRRNTFAPAAGTPPPELARRNTLLESNAVELDFIRADRAAQPNILSWPAGVGRIVLLTATRDAAEGEG